VTPCGLRILLFPFLLKHFCHLVLEDHGDGVVAVFLRHFLVRGSTKGLVSVGCGGEGVLEFEVFDFFDVLVLVVKIVEFSLVGLAVL
jgi:hypothetical protein